MAVTEIDAVGSSCYSTTVYVAFTVDGKTADYCRNKEQLLADLIQTIVFRTSIC